jgi:hypothetical protein
MKYLRDSDGCQDTAMEANGTSIGHELDTAALRGGGSGEPLLLRCGCCSLNAHPLLDVQELGRRRFRIARIDPLLVCDRLRPLGVLRDEASAAGAGRKKESEKIQNRKNKKHFGGPPLLGSSFARAHITAAPSRDGRNPGSWTRHAHPCATN